MESLCRKDREILAKALRNNLAITIRLAKNELTGPDSLIDKLFH